MTPSSQELKDFIIHCLEAKNAENIECISIDGSFAIADYMIVASGRSVKNIKAIAEYIALELKHKLQCSSHIEGSGGTDWVLLDAGSVVLHLLLARAREELHIEELWRTNSAAIMHSRAI